MGAWIETGMSLNIHFTASSHPTWVRGLKQELSIVKTIVK